jgi:chromosome segregation ATPase
MVVEHLRALQKDLGDRQRAVWVARQEHAFGQLGRGLQMNRHRSDDMEDCGASMAQRRTPQDALRDAVERTMQAGQQTREKAQDAVDEMGKAAGKVREQLEGSRPATADDLKELRRELRAIGRRLEKIEERLPG